MRKMAPGLVIVAVLQGIWVTIAQETTHSWTGQLTLDDNASLHHIAVNEAGNLTISKWTYRIQISHSDTIYLYLRPSIKPQRPMTLIDNSCLQENNLYKIYARNNPLVIPLKSCNRCACITSGDGTNDLICEGEIHWASPTPSGWKATVAYDCRDEGQRSPIHMNYTIRAESKSRVQCVPIDAAFSAFQRTPQTEFAIEQCSQLYTHFSAYNSFGFSLGDLVSIVQEMAIATSELRKYYQHVWPYICRLALPGCSPDTGQIQHSCKGLCIDLQNGCQHVPRTIENPIWR